MTRSRRFFASSPWIATGTPDYVNLGYTSRGLAKQALMRLSRKFLAIFRNLGLESILPPVFLQPFLTSHRSRVHSPDRNAYSYNACRQSSHRQLRTSLR